MRRIWRSLTLRIAGPLTVLVLVFGFSLYYLVFTTISGFVQNEIKRDLEDLSHRAYNICNIKFDGMLHSGLADSQDTLIITQALTLGQFEDFFRQENLEGLVYQDESKELLLESTLPLSVEEIMAKEKSHGKIISLETATEDYFAYHFDFSPWDWHIIIIKSKKDYADLITKVQKVHGYTLGLLIITSFLLVFFLHRSIKHPIDAIVKPLKKDQRPKYKGIIVFEFLSDTIAAMMDSLQENEEKYRSLVETTSDFVWEVDKIGAYNYASPAIHTLLGYAPEEMLGKTFFDFIPPAEKGRIQKIIKNIVRKRLPFQGLENECLQKNGQPIVIETSGVPIIDADGRLTGYRGISRDITLRKRAEEDKLLFERRIQNVEKTESLSRMAGAVAHHFNNILAATIGNLELVMDELPPGSQISENVAEAQKSVWRAVEMSSLMLTFLGHSQGNPKPHDLSDNCRRHLVQLQINTAADICVAIDLPDPGPVVKADPAQIRQVLSALFINAEEAMEGSPGELHVSTGTVQAADMPDRYRFPAGWMPSAPAYACLTITDNGRGMKEETIGRIFDPFYTDKFIGRGLGLAVAIGIIKAHGGSISVESAYGSGSTFKVFLPLSDEPLPESREANIQIPLAADRDGTVLLVEDQEVLRNMAKAMLERFGFAVLTASDGQEAVDVFLKNQEDITLVISDMSMPRMNGWETLRALRALQPDIPVILASGYDEDQVMANHDPEQPQAFLHKPYQMKTLKELLDKVLGG